MCPHKCKFNQKFKQLALLCFNEAENISRQILSVKPKWRAFFQMSIYSTIKFFEQAGY